MPAHDAAPERDCPIADSGWGVKPDDQPSNASEATHRASPVYHYDPGDAGAVRRILLAQRRGFNTANRVRVERGRTTIIDINRDEFVVVRKMNKVDWLDGPDGDALPQPLPIEIE